METTFYNEQESAADNTKKGEMTLSWFEHLWPLTKTEQKEVREHFFEVFDENLFYYDETELAFFMDTPGNYPVAVEPDFEYGIVQVDISLDVKTTRQNAASLLAYSNFLCTFYFKRGEVASALVEDSTACDYDPWEIGEPLHFRLVSKIADLDGPEAWRLPMRTAHEIKRGMDKIVSGELTAVQAINDTVCDQQRIVQSMPQPKDRREGRVWKQERIESKVVDLFPVQEGMAEGMLRAAGRDWLVLVDYEPRCRLWVRVRLAEEIDNDEYLNRKEEAFYALAEHALASPDWWDLYPSVDPCSGETLLSFKMTTDMSGAAIDRFLLSAKRFIEKNLEEIDALLGGEGKYSNSHAVGESQRFSNPTGN